MNGLDGKSTSVEVEQLMRLPIERGGSIPYSTIEETTGVRYKDPRWYTIINAWRRRLRRDRMTEFVLRDRAVHFMTAAQLLSATPDRFAKTRRAAHRLCKHTETVTRSHNELTAEQHTLSLLHLREALAVRDEARRAARMIATPPKPVEAATVRLAP